MGMGCRGKTFHLSHFDGGTHLRLTELTRDGALRDLDPLILDAVVLGTANQLLCLHFAGHLALDDAAIRAALDACWHAIAAAPRLTE